MTRSETGSTRSISTGSAGAGGCSPPPARYPLPGGRDGAVHGDGGHGRQGQTVMGL